MNSKLLGMYVTEKDYEQFSGYGWPSYKEFLENPRSENPEIQEKIDSLIERNKKIGIKFPIKTATACQSKWTWSTIYLNELRTSSCHRVLTFPFSVEQMDDFHNTPEKIEARKKMLQGEWPGYGCEYCQHIENAGGWSDRQHNLDIRGLTPPELETDLTAVHVTPRIVEMFAKNTCNLSCMYCNGNLSSKIEQENLKYGDFSKGGVVIKNNVKNNELVDQYFKRWCVWLEKNITLLKRLHLLGGETLLQHDLMTPVLEIIERNPNPNLEFCVFSNMNVPDSVWFKYIDKIKNLQQNEKIKYFDLTASIDCWGPEAEYVRSGLDLKKFEERLFWAAKQGDWLRLCVNQTITALTIKTMPQLIEKIKYYQHYKSIGQYFQFYTGPQMFQHPKNYAYSLWEEDFDKIFSLLGNSTVEQKEVSLRMQGIQKQLQQTRAHNLSEIQKLKIYLDELDRRRGTNWRSLFGYLDV